ncbi:type VI secretion system baseplate subunit TssG [Chitinophaga ginsengisoli]|uniref:Type VI secretion system (T6SS) VasB/ImpH family protein n=1 Tax=Chitinophaga ginsengisoli TaxID=363837 RepID=A0A2P8G9Y4_9BACT|nr:type VI secretion system baseplate subunit TssG [Chitinophaga ginsengisoli]PSL30784.1 type VI secretion system (T6SS) VasB/ImpH family protein [Chitinophaga ginsengisoli]
MVNNAQKAAVLEEVIDHIHRLHYDVRAEVVVGELLDNDVREADVAVQMKNVFTRAFNKDILDAQLDDSQPYHPFVTLTLSRDGLYDRLPEGLFHTFSSQKKQEVSEMVANYKKHQQEEQEARKFFRPLEHEFFLQRVFLEQREKHLLFDAFGKDADALFLSFWGIPQGLPKGPVNKLIRLLPYIHRIAGNLQLVQLYLEAILDEPVEISRENGPVAVSTGNQTGLGDCRLGVDTMTGNLFYTDMPRVLVKVGPLQQHRVYDFLSWQPYGKLLETCLGFLMPADVEVETLLEPHPDEKQVVVADSRYKEGIMGYNFFL